MKSNPLRCLCLVENDGMQARELAEKLESFGYRVSTASGLEKMVERFRTDENVDLILMDLDGEEDQKTIRAVKDILSIRAVPIVFCSSRYEPKDRITMEDIPHYGWVLKCSENAVFPSILDTAFRLFTAHQETRAAEEDLRVALREKEIMMREIHHRVKNNMQVISSLLRLQEWRIPDKKLRDVFRTCQDRIRTMALIHEKLYRSPSLFHIDFREYVQDLVERLFLLSGDRATSISKDVDVDGVNLDVNRAIPCGLIVNELVTNALKHAFPNGGSGTIRLFMRPVSENRFFLVISDNGKGLPAGIDILNPTTLGLQIVKDLIGQLDGTITADHSRGTIFTINF